jgi:hypothetical protein
MMQHSRANRIFSKKPLHAQLLMLRSFLLLAQ